MATDKKEQERIKREITRMESFIKEDPKSKYTLDGQRDSGEGTICRRTPTGLNCVRLNMEAKQLFTEMQRLGFFCALPMDPTRTEIECSHIGK